jgi:hypothetical protein
MGRYGALGEMKGFPQTRHAGLDVRDVRKSKITDFVLHHNEKALVRKLPRPFPEGGKKSFGTVCSVLQAQNSTPVRRSGNSDVRLDSRRGFPYDSYQPIVLFR